MYNFLVQNNQRNLYKFEVFVLVMEAKIMILGLGWVRKTSSFGQKYKKIHLDFKKKTCKIKPKMMNISSIFVRKIAEAPDGSMQQHNSRAHRSEYYMLSLPDAWRRTLLRCSYCAKHIILFYARFCWGVASRRIHNGRHARHATRCPCKCRYMSRVRRVRLNTLCGKWDRERER